MEAWEKGYNIILKPGGTVSEENIRAAAVLLKREPAELKSVLGKAQALPLVRTDLLHEAELITRRLSDAGIDSFIWSDEEADISSPTRRLRGLEISDDTITFLPFNKSAEQTFSWNDVALIVTGSIFEKKISSTAKRKKNEEKQFTEASETSRDEPVIDIYTKDDNTGWRVLTTGFDFSCLGADKGMLAVENIKRLAGLLKERAHNVAVDENYIKVRPALGAVWENEHKMASHKWQRESMGKFYFDNVTAVDNVMQFTRYSRLQWRLLK